MQRAYYGCTRDDAAHTHFDDKFVYDVINGISKKEQVKIIQIDGKEAIHPFKEWELKKDKINY